MQLELLQQANQILNKCGRPELPKGLVCVPYYKGFLLQAFFQSNPAQSSSTIQKEVTAPVKAKMQPRSWAMRSIQMSQPASILLQIQLPGGHFLFNSPMDINQIAGFGSGRYVFTHERECPIGSKIQITLNDEDITATQSFAMLFEGCYKYYLTGGAGATIDDAGCEPRYAAGPSQNILAPCWMTGKYPQAIPGCFDVEEYTFASDVVTMGLNGTGTNTIQIDQATDFAARRLYFKVVQGGSVTDATILVRARSGSGYPMMDDFLISSYIANSPWPHDWDLAAGDQAFIDLQVVDFAGSGTLTVQSFLEGVKRGKK